MQSQRSLSPLPLPRLPRHRCHPEGLILTPLTKSLFWPTSALYIPNSQCLKDKIVVDGHVGKYSCTIWDFTQKQKLMCIVFYNNALQRNVPCFKCTHLWLWWRPLPQMFLSCPDECAKATHIIPQMCQRRAYWPWSLLIALDVVNRHHKIVERTSFIIIIIECIVTVSSVFEACVSRLSECLLYEVCLMLSCISGRWVLSVGESVV